MELSEYMEIVKTVDEERAAMVAEHPDMVCECGHLSDCHSSDYDEDVDNGILWTEFHKCLKCDCEGFWR